jgi:hypothetical protein
VGVRLTTGVEEEWEREIELCTRALGVAEGRSGLKLVRRIEMAYVRRLISSLGPDPDPG